MNKIKILFLLFTAFINPFSGIFFYSFSAHATSNFVQETKIDSDNDGKADYIIYDQKDSLTETVTTLTIQNSIAEKINFRKIMNGLTVVASYEFKDGQYTLTNLNGTKEKVFFEESIFNSDMEGQTCAECSTPTDPRRSIFKSAGILSDISGAAEKDAIEILKQNFPLDNSCKIPGPSNGKHKEFNFENEIYTQILALADPEIVECLRVNTENTEVVAKFQGLPQSLYQTKPPLRPFTLQCANNTISCECSKASPEACVKQNCLSRSIKKQVAGKDELENCDSDDQEGCNNYITRGAFVEGKGIRSIILSNSLRIKDRTPLGVGAVNKEKLDEIRGKADLKRQKLKEVIAHELIHAFGCSDEEETELLVKECIPDRRIGLGRAPIPKRKLKKKIGSSAHPT